MANIRAFSSVSGRLADEGLNIHDFSTSPSPEQLVWLDILQPDEEIKNFLSETMEFDELAIEDVFGHADTTALKFTNHRFLVVNARDADNRLDTEPVAIFIKDSLLITVRHTKIPALETFARRMVNSDPDDLALGIDFLLYELLDAIADDWTPMISRYSRDLDDLEFRVFDPSQQYDDLLEGLHELKRKLREANKSVESLNAVTVRMLKPGERFVSDGVLHYFSDLNQLTLSLLKRITNYSAAATSTRDSYLSSISLQLSESNARLTEVMTTLTIIGAIMLPLTLIAGILGLNNDDLPLDMIGGFWGIIGLMSLFAISMLLYFWRKGWLFDEP